MAAGKYEKVKVVGQGSFGAAVLVRSARDGALYISKEINLEAMSAKDIDAAQNEVEVLTRVKHPNIIEYVEHYTVEGVLYIVMEFADGGDLLGRIKAQRADPLGRRFSEDQVMFWFIQMTLGVKHMHDSKILHRDIKSANIFLTKDNLVKIGDFGFGKIMANSIAQAKTLCGTPYYFSPELCMGKPYNNKSDVWALGCVLAEMCLLGHAYEARNIKELMKRVVHGAPQPIPATYSPELHRLVEKVLTKDQAARPNAKGILLMEYVQSKLRLFAQEEFEMTALTEAPPEAQREEVREMEAFCAREKERGAPCLPPLPRLLPKGDAPAAGSDRLSGRRSARDSPMSSPKTKEADRRRSSGGSSVSKLARDPSGASTEPASGPEAVGVGGLDLQSGDALDLLLSGTPRRPGSATAARPPAVHVGASKPVLHLSHSPRSESHPTRPPGAGAASVRPGPDPGADPFDASGHENWGSILGPALRQSPRGAALAAAAAKEEFGSFALRSGGGADAAHRSVMEHVNATLESRPGTASRERRAQGRSALGRLSPPRTPPPAGFLAKSQSSQEFWAEDFADNGATMSAQTLRALLLMELGEDVFHQGYRIARDDDDDDAEAKRKLAALLGAPQAREVAPLLLRLVMLEHAT